MRRVLAGRHPATVAVARYFTFDHLPPGLPRDMSVICMQLAEDVIASLADSPELTAGLRKLLEAKDCFVRAALDERPRAADVEPPGGG